MSVSSRISAIALSSVASVAPSNGIDVSSAARILPRRVEPLGAEDGFGWRPPGRPTATESGRHG